MSHKPVRLTETQLAHLLNETWSKLQASEERILADAQERLNLQAAVKLRLSQELQELKTFRSSALKTIADLVTSAKLQLKTTAAGLAERVKGTCAAASQQLKEALAALESGDLHFNDLADFLNNLGSEKDLAGLTLTEKCLEVGVADLERVLKSAVTIRVKVLEGKKVMHSRINQVSQTSRNPEGPRL